MTLQAALAHPVVAKHPAVKALAKAQQKLDRAKRAQLERTQAADAAHRLALAKWSAEHDAAVLEGRAQLPPKPVPEASTTGAAQALLIAEGQRLAEEARTILSDLAVDLVLRLAADLDAQLADVKAGPVAAVPDALVRVNTSRLALWNVARTRWSPVQLPPSPEPITAADLVVLALGPAGVYSDQWGAVVEADRAAAERAARQAAEMAELAERAAQQEGRLVADGLGYREALVPVPVKRAAWGR